MWEALTDVHPLGDVRSLVILVALYFMFPKEWRDGFILLNGLLAGATSVVGFAVGLSRLDPVMIAYHGFWVLTGVGTWVWWTHRKQWRADRIIKRNFWVGAHVRMHFSGEPLIEGTITSVDLDVGMVVVRLHDGRSYTVDAVKIRQMIIEGETL